MHLIIKRIVIIHFRKVLFFVAKYYIKISWSLQNPSRKSEKTLNKICFFHIYPFVNVLYTSHISVMPKLIYHFLIAKLQYAVNLFLKCIFPILVLLCNILYCMLSFFVKICLFVSVRKSA